MRYQDPQPVTTNVQPSSRREADSSHASRPFPCSARRSEWAKCYGHVLWGLAETQPARLESTGLAKPAHRLAQNTLQEQACVCCLASLGSWLWRWSYIHSCFKGRLPQDVFQDPLVQGRAAPVLPGPVRKGSRPRGKTLWQWQQVRKLLFSLVLNMEEGSHSGFLSNARDLATACLSHDVRMPGVGTTNDKSCPEDTCLGPSAQVSCSSWLTGCAGPLQGFLLDGVGVWSDALLPFSYFLSILLCIPLADYLNSLIWKRNHSDHRSLAIQNTQKQEKIAQFGKLKICFMKDEDTNMVLFCLKCLEGTGPELSSSVPMWCQAMK